MGLFKRSRGTAIREDGSFDDHPLTLKERVRAFFGEDEVTTQRNFQELQREGYDLIASIGERRKVKVSGIITSLVLHPASQGASVEADLSDGTGTITLIWLGRDSITGIVPGSKIEVQGFAARRDRKRVMYNPKYTLKRIPGEAK